MSPHLKKAVADLRSSDYKTVQDAIIFIAEVATFNRRGIESEIVPEANEERLGPDEMQALMRSLIGFIEGEPFGTHANSAIWALDKFCDRTLIKIYQVWLQRYVNYLTPSAFALGSVVVSLTNLGENVVTGGSFSAKMSSGRTSTML